MKQDGSAYGRLFMVATPIGNWGDISQRALEYLNQAALIAAEDTRYALRLMSQYGIKKKVVSCHQNNELKRADLVVYHLERGEDVAFVSDSGVPGVSDPGAQLVETIASLGFEVVAAPGPSAVTAAVSVSGLGSGGFHFLGFLPRTKSKQVAEFQALKRSARPLVVFESPRRIRDLLENAIEAIGDRTATLCREITKIHEETLRGRLSEILAALPAEPLGEITLVIAGMRADEREGMIEDISDEKIEEQAKADAVSMVAGGMSRGDAAAAIMDRYGIKKRVAYQITKALEAPESTSTRSVTFSIRGNTGIRATHDKTIEFKRTSDVSERETCVLGAGADWDSIAIKKLRGKVRVTVKAAGISDSFECEICQRFNSLERMVFRKSAATDRVTIAIHATKGASSISQQLVEVLQNESVAGEVVIETI